MDGKLDNTSGRKFVLMTKLESDDTYHKEMIDIIQGYELRERGGLVCDRGYVLFCDKPSIRRRIRWEIGKLATKLKLK